MEGRKVEEGNKPSGGGEDKVILEEEGACAATGKAEGSSAFYQQGGNRGAWRGRGGGGRGRGGGSKHGRDLPPVPVPFENMPSELIPKEAVDISADKSGKLWKVTLCEGDDSEVNFLPRRGSLVKVHYRLWLLDDPEKKTIDSSTLMEGEEEEPVEFNVGARQVIRMLEDGVRTMSRKGEKILLLGHFDYAFGRHSEGGFTTSNIPNGSFVGGEMELVDVEGGGKMEGGGGMKREVLEVGDKVGDAIPLTTDSVMFVRVEGWKEGDGGEKEVILEGKVIPFVPGWDVWGWREGGGGKGIPNEIGRELRCMREGDRVRWRIEGKGEELVFEVKVEEIEEVEDPFTMSLKEKVEVCGRMMEKGIEFWREGWWEAAGSKMERVREYLMGAKEFLKEVPKELGGKVDELLFGALMKLVELEGKVEGMGEREALDYANEAVVIVEGMEGKDFGGMEKAEVWRVRGELWKRMGEWEKAEEDFGRAVEVMKGKLEGKEEEKMEGALEEKLRQMKIKLEGEVERAKELGRKEKKEYLFKYVPPK